MRLIKHFLFLSFVFLSVCAEKIIAAPLTEVNPRAGLISALKQHPPILDFYKENEYELIWLKNNEVSQRRRAELINSLKTASFHGLPAKKYQVEMLLGRLSTSHSLFEIGFLEGLFMISFAEYASDISSGVLVPSDVDINIVREIKLKDPIFYIRGLISRDPYDYFRSLGPQSSEYSRLLVEKYKLIKVAKNGGWSTLSVDRVLRFGILVMM